jgi:hypothetical protein
MPLKIVNKEPVEYYSNLEGSLDSSSPLNLNQNLLNQQQQQSHAETFLDLYKNSPTTRDYNINVNADLANRISGGLGSVPVIGGTLSTMADVAMPAAAFIGSPFYDAIQGTYRGITDPDKSVWQAIKDENIGSTMWERMIGASTPLSERLSNWKDDFSIYGKAFAGDYIQNPKIQRFKQQQLMNRRKQQMQKTIRQAEAAEAAKKKKITTGGPPSITQKKNVITTGGPPSITQKKKKKKKWTPTHQTGGGGGIHGGGGSKKGSMPTGTKGKNPWGRADGGLIRLFKYGGYLG